MEDLEDAQILNDKLRLLVNKSSVEAVDSANAERKQALRDCQKKIKDIKTKSNQEIYEAQEKVHKAETEANIAKETLKKKSFLYFGLLAFTLVCSAIMNSTVRHEIIAFFAVSSKTIYKSLYTYIEWLISLSYIVEWYWAWLIRILLTVTIIICFWGIFKNLKILLYKYKQRWCFLSLKVLVCCFATLTIFAKPIRSFIPINIVPLFIITQIGYLLILFYLDEYYSNRCRNDDWAQIQNS